MTVRHPLDGFVAKPIEVDLASHPAFDVGAVWNLAARDALAWARRPGGASEAFQHVTIVGAPCADPQTGAFRLLRDDVILARAMELLGKRGTTISSPASLEIFDLAHGSGGDYLAAVSPHRANGVLILAMVPNQLICAREGHDPPPSNPAAYLRSGLENSDHTWIDAIAGRHRPGIIVSFGASIAYITAELVARASDDYVMQPNIDRDDPLIARALNAPKTAASVLAKHDIVTQIAIRRDFPSAADCDNGEYAWHLVKHAGRRAVRGMVGRFANALKPF